ncbi:MAG TPA: hypothetical protein QF361_04085 [Gammaproteobacteria bacterium]|nr:hypothetical protein [Gammaproteobacteria bacterium]
MMTAEPNESSRRPESGRTDWVQRRWEIWQSQERAGHAICFATERRHVCEESDCRWWQECQQLRADWIR